MAAACGCGPELDTGAVHPRTGSARVGSDQVGSQVRFYAVFAYRVGSRVIPNIPKFVLKI